MKWHAYAETFPLLEGREYEHFRADIAANGMREPIKYRLVNGGEKEYLDGRNRYAISQDLQIPCPELKVDVPDDAVEKFVDSLNLHRRHLTPKYIKERRQRIAEARAGGKSIRAIAKEEEVSVGTVHSDLSASGVQSQLNTSPSKPPSPPKVTGQDGKSYPAAKAKKLCKACQHRKDVGKPLIDKCDDCAAANKPKGDSKPKPGKPKFNEKRFEKAFGSLVRVIDERGNLMGKGEHFKKCHKLMDDFLEEYKRWKKVS